MNKEEAPVIVSAKIDDKSEDNYYVSPVTYYYPPYYDTNYYQAPHYYQTPQYVPDAPQYQPQAHQTLPDAPQYQPQTTIPWLRPLPPRSVFFAT